MDLPHELVDGLALLSDALEDPYGDLGAVLSVLTDDLTALVPQYLGLTVTLHSEDNAVNLSTMPAGDNDIRASLLLSLSSRGLSNSRGSIVFYGGQPGSFIDLADDARWIFNLDGLPVVDGHLATVTTRSQPASIHGLTELSSINQAIGVLIEDGFEPQEALAELRRRNFGSGHSLPVTARQLLDSLPVHPTPTVEWEPTAS